MLGWRFRPGTRPGYWHPETAAGFPSPMVGLSGGAERAVAVPWFRVPDLDAAVAAVRAAGGTATGPDDAGPAGRHAACTDDQGMAFDLVGR
ncbi:hypothetical protein BJF78_22030 [Pseudonocardia sp. CNS-139]|nr:hypothetical protein BJF78_22030 [Pseudonocardia sp. CNS-139]